MSPSANAPIIKIYHIEGRRSLRVIWLCEELGLPYELIFKPGDLMGSMAMLRQANPLMPLEPTVEYQGKIVVESGAIVEILQSRHGNGRLAPSLDSEDYPHHVQWVHFAEGTAMYRFWAIRFASIVAEIPVEQIPAGHRVNASVTDLAGKDAMLNFLVGTHAVADYMEDFLSKHPYFGGKEFSAADIMMQFIPNGAKLTAGFDTKNFPRIQAWLKKVESRPAFQRAMKAAVPGGANQYGLPVEMPLPFPEPTGPAPLPSISAA